MFLDQLIISLFNALGLMALFAVCCGLIERFVPARWCRWMQGVALGFGAVATMLSPAVILPGVIIDARCVFVGIAAAFAGWRGALAATLLASLYRLWLGGGGMDVGIATTVVTALAGLWWSHVYAFGNRADLKAFAILGLASGAHILFFLLLPVADPHLVFLQTAPVMLPAYLIGTIAMGLLMQRERRLIARERSLEADALTDSLTGLANRRAYRILLEAELAGRSPDAPLSLLVLDIDHFKRVNDTYGHEVGDRVIRRVARTLRKLVDRQSFVFRVGGEEFCILLPGVGERESYRCGQAICAAVRHSELRHRDDVIRLSISVGIATTRDGAATSESLYSKADSALYAAKRGGRDRAVAADVRSEPRQASSAKDQDNGAPLRLVANSPA